MTGEEDKFIQSLLANQSAGLKAYAALTVEQRKQVLEKAQGRAHKPDRGGSGC